MTDIWAVANHRKGRRTALFPPLRDTNGSAIDTPDGKALIFKDKFFLGNPTPVPLYHPSNPAPQEPQTWTLISPDKVTQALRTMSNKSAPGLSGVGYKLLNGPTLPALTTYCICLTSV